MHAGSACRHAADVTSCSGKDFSQFALPTSIVERDINATRRDQRQVNDQLGPLLATGGYYVVTKMTEALA